MNATMNDTATPRHRYRVTITSNGSSAVEGTFSTIGRAAMLCAAIAERHGAAIARIERWAPYGAWMPADSFQPDEPNQADEPNDQTDSEGAASTSPEALAWLDTITPDGWCRLVGAAYRYAQEHPNSSTAAHNLHAITAAAEILAGFGQA